MLHWIIDIVHWVVNLYNEVINYNNKVEIYNNEVSGFYYEVSIYCVVWVYGLNLTVVIKVQCYLAFY